MTAVTSKEIEKLLEVVYAIDKKRVSPEDIVEIVKILTDYARETRDFTKKDLARIALRAENISSELKDENGKSLLETKKEVESRLNGALKTFKEEVSRIAAEHKGFMDYLYDRVARVRDGKDGKDGVNGINGTDGKDADPKVVAEMVKKDLLPNLEKELRKIGDDIGKRAVGAVQTPKRVWTPWVDNLSSFTDGSTKTFYLSKAPRDLDTIKGWGSDFPHILHRSTDFTVAGKLITLNASVPAPSSGSTLIFEYYT